MITIRFFVVSCLAITVYANTACAQDRDQTTEARTIAAQRSADEAEIRLLRDRLAKETEAKAQAETRARLLMDVERTFKQRQAELAETNLQKEQALASHLFAVQQQQQEVARALPNLPQFQPSAGDKLGTAIKEYRAAEASSEERETARQAVAEALSEHYDTFLKAQEQELVALEEKLAKLREQLKNRQDAKERMVELKLEMVLAQADGLGWPEGNTGNRTVWFSDNHGSASAGQSLFAPSAPAVRGGASSGLSAPNPTVRVISNDPHFDPSSIPVYGRNPAPNSGDRLYPNPPQPAKPAEAPRPAQPQDVLE